MVGINKNIFGKNSIKEEKRVKYGISIGCSSLGSSPLKLTDLKLHLTSYLILSHTLIK